MMTKIVILSQKKTVWISHKRKIILKVRKEHSSGNLGRYLLFVSIS